jgi:outer membrane receptor protein involved in Fe transport
MNNTPHSIWNKTAVLACGFLSATCVTYAQDAEDEVFELSPFTIDASQDEGYYASQTMAGGRLSGSLKDSGAAIQVITKEFMDDLGANGIEELLQYTTSSEVAGILGNFTGATEGGEGETSTGGARAQPDGTSRIRGLAAPDRTRNFFVTDIPFDSYNTERIDINRGANSFLFGLGSPAGLINNGMAKAQFRNSTEFSTRIGSGGENPSYRASFGINRVVLEDKLAIRVNGLMDRTEYRQRPTYKNDDRIYTAFTYRPFGNENTVISGHLERGEIVGNAPDVLLPQNNLDTFLDLPARQNASQRVKDPRNPFGTRHHEGPNANQWNNAAWWPEEEKQAYLDAGYILRDEGGELAYRNIRWGAGAYGFVWDGSNGLDAPAFGYTDQYRGADIERNPNGDEVPNYWSGGATTGNIRGGTGGNNGGAPQGLYPGNRGEINGTGWLDQGFLDLETFDFSRANLGWDNDYYTRDFFNYNFSLTQSFWEGKGGFEVAYDYQDLYRDSHSAFNGANSVVTFDVNETLLLPADPNYAVSGNFDPLPNPNFGRPVVLTKSGSQTIDEQREAFRFTGFVKYDFADNMNSDNLAKILGNHTLTILADENIYNENRINWTQDSYGDPDPALHIGVPNGRFSANNVRNIPNLVYVGPQQLDAYESGFQLSDFELTPAKYNIRGTLGNTYEKLSWNRGPDATNEVLITGADASNGNEQWLTHTYTPTKVPSKNVRLQETSVTSLAANTASKFLDNHLVVNMGYREDTIENWLNSEPNLIGIDELSDVRPGFWNLEDGTFIKNKQTTFGYGGVVYWPRDIVALPEAFDDITFHYNTSENFIPATDRVDELRNPVASPTGTSKDYGISFYMWENKFVARINWYEAVLAGATAPTSNSYNQNISGMFTHWGQLNRSIKDLDADGDRMVDEAWLTDRFDYVPGETPYTGEVPAFEEDGVIDPARSYADLVAEEYPFLNEVYAARDSVAPFLTDPLKVAYNFSERANGQSTTQWAGQITDTQDISAKGMEAEFIINPTKSWRIAFNAAKQKTVLTNFAPRLEKILEDFWIPHLEQYGGLDWNAPAEPVAGDTTLENRNDFLLDYFALKGNEGKPNAEQREWRFNLVTNYTFREGALKGWSIGGAARWQDEYAGGYPTIADPNSVLILPDVDNPWLVESDLAIDLTFGYRKKIWDNVDWRMQVNLKNVDNWDNADLEFTRYQPDGTPARARFSAPRTVFLTNTFRF